MADGAYGRVEEGDWRKDELVIEVLWGRTRSFWTRCCFGFAGDIKRGGTRYGTASRGLGALGLAFGVTENGCFVAGSHGSVSRDDMGNNARQSSFSLR